MRRSGDVGSMSASVSYVLIWMDLSKYHQLKRWKEQPLLVVNYSSSCTVGTLQIDLKDCAVSTDS